MEHALNWLWQGTVVAAAAWVILRLLARSRAQFRYALCWIVLAIVLALPMVPVRSFNASPPIAPPPGPTVSNEVILAVPDAWWPSTNMALSLWALWFAAYGVRVAAALLTLRRAKGRCEPFPPMVEARLEYWNHFRTRGRATHLVLSNDVRAAGILGCGSPIIAVAPALIDHLDDGELDRVVIHEWAHVQRRDDLLNIAQLATRAIAGWHPAVWWLHRQLQIEREAACDEMTVALTGSAKSYAASLAKTASLAPARRAVPALGVLSSPGLRTRVIRILSYGRLVSKTRSVSASMAGAACVVALAFAIAGLRLIGPAALATPLEAVDDSATASIDRKSNQATLIKTSSSNPEQRPSPRSTRKPGVELPPPRDVNPFPDGSAPPSSDASPATAETVAAAIDERAPAPPPLAIVSVGPPPGVPAVNTVGLGAPPPTSPAGARTPWGAAADTGVSVGRASQKAAVATAGFFTRLSKKIAGSL